MSEHDALARGEPVIDCARVEGLRFELDIGIWRADSMLIARRVLADAELGVDGAESEGAEGAESEAGE